MSSESETGWRRNLDLGGHEPGGYPLPGHSMGSIGLYIPRHENPYSGDVVYADYAIGRFDLYGADPPDLKNL